MDLNRDEQPGYPPAERLDLIEELHGRPVADPYRGLEDADSASTRAWSAAQDALFAEHSAHWPHREGFATRIGELLATGSVGVPIWRGDRCFRMRRSPGQEHAVLTVSEPVDGRRTGTALGTEERTERVLIDPIALDPTGLTTLDAWQPSKEGALLAYQLSSGGTEESALRVMDVATGAIVDGPIDRVRSSPVAWLPDGEGFYYVRRQAPELLPPDETQFHRRVQLHRLGTPTADDQEIFGAGHDPRSYYGVSVSRDGGWLLLSRSTGTEPRNDLWIAELSTQTLGAPSLREVQVGLDAQTHGFIGRDGKLYLSTDLHAPRGRFVVTDPHEPEPHTWHTLIASQDDDAVLEDVARCDGDELPEPVLVASWRRHAVSELTVHSADGAQLPDAAGRVALPGLGSVGGLIERYDGGPVIWFGYTDHTTPHRVYAFDARTGTATIEATPPGAAELRCDIDSQQVTYTSSDGTPVRMFVLRAAPGSTGSTSGDQTPAPTILYGYGGFGASMTPAYSAQILTWLEAGGIYAVANLRGGDEEGEEWHRAGMLANKHHVFEDFETAAEWLIDAGLTTPERLCISGGSNGGLLVGAALTRRPALYAAVLCSAPLLDMVRYERFGLGVTWNVEYGSADVPEELDWLLGYSPYHHVREGTAYPATLFTVFDGDTRVDPLHARKMCAALQHATTSSRPILLRRETDVGHSARSLSRSIALAADSLAFAAEHTRMDPAR